MSDEFHKAEQALFMKQAKEVDIIITTVRWFSYDLSRRYTKSNNYRR